MSILAVFRLMIALIVMALSLPFQGRAYAEEVHVKYRGLVDLAPFVCEEVTRSSFIRRVCYDRNNQYMVILLNSTYYHYCEIDERTVRSLMQAVSMGKFFNTYILGDGTDGPFDCRTHRIPGYQN